MNSAKQRVYTSNDLLSELAFARLRRTQDYDVIVQSAEEGRDIENNPAISIGPYLLKARKTQMLAVISVYAQRGDNRNQARLFYMNSAALLIWKAMKKHPLLLGRLHRPPRTATLLFGVPFGE